jgi:hypothetical protein
MIQNHEYFVSLLIYNHDNQPKLADWKRLLNHETIGVDIDAGPVHDKWNICQCNASSHIKELVEKYQMSMDEDSPNNQLTTEEHITLFNKVKLLSSKTETEELIKRRALMKKAVAIQRTHIQGMTVEINERRTRASRKEKEAIIAADKKYQPNLRAEEKITVDQEHEVRKANEDSVMGPFLKRAPAQARQALLSLIAKIGYKEARNIMFPEAPPINDVNPDSEPGNQTENEDSNDENEG